MNNAETIRREIDYILRMDVGQSYMLDIDLAEDVVAMLKYTPLGGRRFKALRRPDTFDIEIRRVPDETDQQRFARRQAERRARQKREDELRQAQTQTYNHMANMRNAATMAQFEADKKAYEEQKAEEPKAQKGSGKVHYDRNGNKLDHKPTLGEKLRNMIGGGR